MTEPNKSPEIIRLQSVIKKIGTIEQIAEETGVAARTIQNTIWNDQPIGAALLRQLHVRYGVSLDWLLTGVGSMFVKPKPDTQPPLIPAFEHKDFDSVQDVFIHAAASVEQAMRQCGAVPGEDYALRDLFSMAQPFAATQFKKNKASLDVAD